LSILKFVVLSDLHLVKEGVLSHGLDTTERLRAGVAAINARHADADFCVLAGDLADLGDTEAYERLKDCLADLSVPLHITIGNHDNRDTFLEVFGAEYAADTGCVDKVIDAKGQRVILLDSAVTGQHGGRLEPIQLNWLATRLAEAHDVPVTVILHHHANPLHTKVDRIILENGPEFVAVLKTHDQIRQVIAGHVHYTSTAMWQGVPFTTLAGGHYNVTIPLGPDADPVRLDGPAQMAVVLSDDQQTLVHFDNYLDASVVLQAGA
jgi:3',5'-cyclic AMP phosphodiesterase CpdA